MGSPSLRESLKSWGAICVIQTLCSSRSWELEVPSQLNDTVSGVGYIVKVCLSLPTHFSVVISSFTQCVGVTQLVSGFISKGIAPCAVTHSVPPWEEGGLGASYIAMLVPLHVLLDLYSKIIIPNLGVECDHWGTEIAGIGRER